MKILSKYKILIALLVSLMAVCSFLGISSLLPRSVNADTTSETVDTTNWTEIEELGTLPITGRYFRLYSRTKEPLLSFSSLYFRVIAPSSYHYLLYVENGVYRYNFTAASGHLEVLQQTDNYIDFAVSEDFTYLYGSDTSTIHDGSALYCDVHDSSFLIYELTESSISAPEDTTTDTVDTTNYIEGKAYTGYSLFTSLEGEVLVRFKKPAEIPEESVESFLGSTGSTPAFVEISYDINNLSDMSIWLYDEENAKEEVTNLTDIINVVCETETYMDCYINLDATLTSASFTRMSGLRYVAWMVGFVSITPVILYESFIPSNMVEIEYDGGAVSDRYFRISSSTESWNDLGGAQLEVVADGQVVWIYATLDGEVSFTASGYGLSEGSFICEVVSVSGPSVILYFPETVLTLSHTENGDTITYDSSTTGLTFSEDWVSVDPWILTELVPFAQEDTDGDENTGDENTGDENTGDENTGDENTGDENTGDENTGDGNTGDESTGDENTGDENTGDENTGDGNTGDESTGDENTSDENTGDKNVIKTNLNNNKSGKIILTVAGVVIALGIIGVVDVLTNKKVKRNRRK